MTSFKSLWGIHMCKLIGFAQIMNRVGPGPAAWPVVKPSKPVEPVKPEFFGRQS